MNTTYLAEQASDKPFLLRNENFSEYLNENTLLILATAIIAVFLVTLFIVALIKDRIVLGMVSMILFAVVLTVGGVLLYNAYSTKQTPEEFETWIHDRYGISVSIEQKQLRTILAQSENQELLTDEGDIVIVKRVNNRLILIESDDSNKELPLKSDR